MSQGTAQPRFLTLDAIRGVAVMGILLANIVAFGLPESAYFSPVSWGGSSGWNRIVWFANFVLVEGKMRGLFSFLFGASTLLVIERAEAAYRSGAAAHLTRMAALFVIGCAHLYLLWWGDILAHYALVGAIALLFTPLRARTQALIGVALLALHTLYNAAGLLALFASEPRATPAQIATWDAFQGGFGIPPYQYISAEIAAIRGSFLDAVAWRWRTVTDPFTFAELAGGETLSAVLLGMAAYRTGFVTGAWPQRRYWLIAAVALPLSLGGYAVLGALTLAHDFAPPYVFLGSIVASAPLRVLGFVGYAALLIALVAGGGALTRRFAAVGRMAFSNYLMTTMAMDLVFTGWGLGQFARLSRAQLYLLVPPVWLAMLLWSPAWLARFRYGPFEWLWRSLARARVQPMRVSPRDARTRPDGERPAD